jgi:hypothetical protein
MRNLLWAHSRTLIDYSERAMRDAASARSPRRLAYAIAFHPAALYPVPYALATAAALLATTVLDSHWAVSLWAGGMAAAHVAALKRMGRSWTVVRYKNELSRLVAAQEKPKSDKRARHRRGGKGSA